MWSGDIQFVDNTCSNEGQLCTQTYFSDLAERLDSECTNGSWQQAGVTPEPEPVAQETCPIEVFADGTLLNTDNERVNNSCRRDGMLYCPDTLFPSGRTGGACIDATWVLGGPAGDQGTTEPNPEPDFCPTRVFDNGTIFSAGQTVPNTCGTAGQRCLETFFSPGRIGAICTDEQWQLIGPTGGQATPPDQCPARVNGDIMFTTSGEQLQNTCNNEGQRCTDTLFLPGVAGAICTTGQWEVLTGPAGNSGGPAGAGSNGASLPLWAMLLLPISGIKRKRKKTMKQLVATIALLSLIHI